MIRALVIAMMLGLLGIAAAIGWGAWALTQPLPIDDVRMVEVERGASLARTLRALEADGILEHPELLRLWARIHGSGATIHAGEYRLRPGMTPLAVLDDFVAGRVVRRHFTVIEGWRFSDLRRALAAAPRLRADTADLTDEEIMARLGRPDLPAEGRFFPDTYDYLADQSDLVILRRALARMDEILAREWQGRSFGLPYETPEEVLVMASVVEKETGLPSERPKVAAVFVRRLERGMRLQTDPTVIYGLGEDFGGTLTRADLRKDTPWNTYVHHGLPPTPIAMPGLASIRAALHPAETDALYFVARGDGSSHFSATLEEHNAAVWRYLRGGRDSAREAP
ncbi:MAG: endolytic transglycosylase MltG [Gammaproteobacteria bacterium]|nr:endolytic transglycosylase MltG [Gammaproteobacteria bacterium]